MEWNLITFPRQFIYLRNILTYVYFYLASSSGGAFLIYFFFNEKKATERETVLKNVNIFVATKSGVQLTDFPFTKHTSILAINVSFFFFNFIFEMF